jgi:hypothetical protein
MRASALALTTALALMSASTALGAAPPALAGDPSQPIERTGTMAPPVLQEDTALQAAIGSDARPAADVARDRYRHPYETLTFWGLTPGTTVVEISPGRGGWWTAILQPYAAETGGRYVPVPNPAESMVVEDGTADMVLVARAFHTLIIDDSPVMDVSRRNEAKRFITLIDVLYENHVKLVASADAEPGGLYIATDGREAFEFERTASRLIEMRSESYLAFGHGRSVSDRHGDMAGLIET